MSLTLARNVETGRWTITDGSGLEVVVTTNRGRVLNFSATQKVQGIFQEGDGYFAIVETSGKNGPTWSRFDFNAAGNQLGSRAVALDVRALLALETTLSADLNGDADFGFQTTGEALNRNGGAVEVYALSAGALGIVTNAGTGSKAIQPLLDIRGNLWSAGAGREVVAVRAEGDAWKIMVEEEYKGDKRYFEFDVTETGTVASRAKPLSEFEAIALEGLYGGSINGELTAAAELAEEFQKAGDARLDRGNGDVSVWNISAGGFGIIVIDDAGEDTFFALKNADGTRFLPASDQSIIAVRQEGPEFRIILETVRPLSTTYVELVVSANGTVAFRGEILRGDAVFNAEVSYITDVNNDGVITVPSGRTLELRLDPEANRPLDFSGSQGTIILNGEEYGASNTLTLLGNSAVQLINFTGTIVATGLSAGLAVATVGATTIMAQAAAGGITLTGVGDVTIAALSTSVDASGSSGALTITTVESSTPTIITGSGTTIINSGNNNALVNAALLADTLEVNGAGVVSVTELSKNVDAVDFSGAFSATTIRDATLTATTGSGNTVLTSSGTGTITVAGGALASTSTLTLNGSSAFVSNDLSDTTLAYTGSGSLSLVPAGGLTLDLGRSTGVVTVDTSAQGTGRLTVTGTPLTGATITGDGTVTVNVEQADTSLANVAATIDLTVVITAPGSTTLTADQADGATVTGPTADSLAITDSAAETLYDFAGVAVTNTSVTFTSGGVLATTAFGSVNRFVILGDSTVTMTTSQASGKNLVANGSNKIVFDLANGNNLNMVVPVANMPANYDLALQANATVVMFVTQHENAGAVSGAGNEQIILEGGGTVHARPDIETYQQADAGALTVVVSDENTGVNVTGNSDNTNVNVGDLTVTGTYDLSGGTNTLQLGAGADISMVNNGALTTAQTVVVAGAATMTTAQHQDFTTITGGGVTDEIVLTTGGALTAAIAIESYVLSDAGNIITTKRDKRDVNITGGDGDDTVIIADNFTRNGTYALGGGTNKLQLSGGADLRGVNGGQATTADTVVFTGTIGMTTVQHNAFTTFSSVDGLVKILTAPAALEAITAQEGVSAYQNWGLGSLAITITDANPSVNIFGSNYIEKIIVAQGVEATGSYSFGNASDELILANDADISGASVDDSRFQMILQDAASVTMTTAQHAKADFGVIANLTNTINFTDAGNVTARAATNYVLADGDQTFTLANANQKVTTGSGNFTISTGDVTSFTTGAVNGTGSTTTLLVAANADISGLSLTSVETIDLATDVSATMTLAQNALIASASGSNTVTLSEAGAAEAAAQVEAYVLHADGNTLTVNAAKTDVAITGVAGNDTVIVGNFAVTGSYDLGGGANVLQLGDGANISGATILATGGSYAIAIEAGASVTMTSAQHALITSAPGVETVTLSDALATLTANAAVESYVLDDGDQSFVLATGAQSVTTGTGNVTISTGDVTSFTTGTVNGTGSTTTLLVAQSADISGLSLNDVETIDLATDVSATMKLAQNALIASASGTNTVTLSEAGAAEAAAQVEAYVLHADGNTLTVNAAKTDVAITGGAGNDTVIVGNFAVTGSYDLGGGANVLQLGDGANIAGAAISAKGGSYAIEIENGESVTMTSAQHAFITSAPSVETVTLSDALTTLTANAAVESYVLANGDQTFTLANANQTVTTGTGNVTISTGAVASFTTGAVNGTDSATTLLVAANANISGLSLTSVETIDLASDVSATMTLAQNGLIATALGANTVTLSEAGAAEAAAEVEAYVLAAGGNTLTVNAAKTDVAITGGAGDDTVIVGNFAVTGSYDLGGGANVLQLGDGANIAGATILATGGSYAIAIEAGASVTMTREQNALITIASGENKVTLSDAGQTQGHPQIENYVLADGNQRFFIGAEGQAITTGTGSVEIATTVLTGGLDGLSSTLQLIIYGTTDTLDFSSVSVSGLDSLFVQSGGVVLSADQATGVSAFGNGMVIVKDATPTTDLSGLNSLQLELHLSGSADLRENSSLSKVDRYVLQGTGILTLLGMQASGIEIDATYPLANQRGELWLIGLPGDVDLAQVDVRSVLVTLDADTEIVDSANIEPVTVIFLGGKELTIVADKLVPNLVRFQAGSEAYFWYSSFTPDDDTIGSVVVTGVQSNTDLSSFIFTYYGVPPVTARIDANDTVDISSNETLQFVTAFDVREGATLTVTAAQASGLTAFGTGTLIVTGLAMDTDLSGYADTLTLKAEVSSDIDVTSNANLGPLDEIAVNLGSTLTISAEQADELSVTGEGEVVILIDGTVESIGVDPLLFDGTTLSGIVVDGGIQLAPTSLLSLFKDQSNFNGDVSWLDTSNATNSSGMFMHAGNFNQDIGDWDVSNVTFMTLMFRIASAFNQDIGDWDVGNNKDMLEMFRGASAFNQDIGGWNVSKVNRMSEMFREATAFDQDLGGWNVGTVRFMNGMFGGSGMSVNNLDSTLVGWSDINTHAGETGLQEIGALGLGINAFAVSYSNATAVQELRDSWNWEMHGGIKASEKTIDSVTRDIVEGLNTTDDKLDQSSAVRGQIIHGLGGNDEIIGSAYDDILYAGRGNDVLTGGAGSDSFVFMYRTEGANTITDFTEGAGGNDPEGDIVDIAVLLDVDLSGLVDGAAKADALFDEFIFFNVDDHGNLRIEIDADGVGPNAQHVSVTLEGYVFDLEIHNEDYLASLIDQGNLLV